MSVLRVPTTKIEGVRGIENMTHTLFDVQSEIQYYLITIYTFENEYFNSCPAVLLAC